MNNQLVNLISQALRNEGIYSPEVLAYALATIQHETAGTMQPIREYGGPQQARKYGYSGGTNYYGRGYIQLTHDYNYKQIGQRIGLGDNLYRNPDLALEPEISAKILAAFFKDRGVAQKVQSGDLIGARRPINPDNLGQKIAGYAQNYLGQLPTANMQQVQPTQQPVQKKDSILNGIIKTFAPKQVSASSNLQSQYTPAQGQNQYVVKAGDTLSKISQQYLGSPNAYNKISGYSSGNPNLIYPGEVLRW